MKNIKKPTNWHITNEAREIMNQLEKSKANMNAIQTAPLAISLIIQQKDRKHQKLSIEKSKTGKVHTGRYAEIPGIDNLGVAYRSVFKDSEPNDIWLNIEKAISVGISIIRDNYFDEDTGLIEWDRIAKDIK